MTELLLVRGSVIDQDVEAIVNAASIGMRGGGGLDGAVHHAAGPALLEELLEKVPSGSPPGSVVVTAGHASGFKAILHTPGPVWKGGSRGEPDTLAACYRNCLIAAHDLGIVSIAVPSISTGIYGYPLDRAAPLAVKTVQDWITANEETALKKIIFAMFGGEEYVQFKKALA